jgi:class 3 adenylate cyclase
MLHFMYTTVNRLLEAHLEGTGVREVIRCLVIDDSEDDRFHLIRMLRKDSQHTYDIIEAGSGEEGLALLERGPFDVVVLDYRLPGDDGLTLLPVLRRRAPQVAIVFLTGYTDQSVSQRALAEGADHFLQKDELSSTAANHAVRAALERRRSEAIRGELDRVGEMARVMASYVPEDLVHSMARSSAEAANGVELAAERFPCGIMFGDIANFSSVGEFLGPEATIQFLSRVYARFERLLREHGGILDKIIGDGILALFPARDLPDEGVADLLNHAVECGLELIRTYRSEWDQVHLYDVASTGFRVGLAYGEVIRGNVGSSRRRDFTVVGRTVNLAKRLESYAPVDSLLTEREVFQHLRDPGRAIPLGSVQLKGVPESVHVYRLSPNHQF